MRNLYVLFMASAFLTSVGCSPTSVRQPGADTASPAQNVEETRELNNEETLMDRANALLKAGKFIPTTREESQNFDTPFEISFDDESQISNITTKGQTEHPYSSDNSILKDDTQIFVPTWWNEDTDSDVVVFLVKRDDNGISGQIHEISSDMMKVLYAASFTEESLKDLGYQYGHKVKAVFEIAAEDIQASSTVQPSSSNLIYAVNSDNGIELRLLSETEIANIEEDAQNVLAALRAKAAEASQKLQNAEDAISVQGIEKDAQNVLATLRAKAAQTSQELQNAEDAIAEQVRIQAIEEDAQNVLAALRAKAAQTSQELQDAEDAITEQARIQGIVDAMLEEKSSEEAALFVN